MGLVLSLAKGTIDLRTQPEIYHDRDINAVVNILNKGIDAIG